MGDAIVGTGAVLRAGRRRDMRRWVAPLGTAVVPLVTTVVIVGVWEGAVRAFNIPIFLMPPPSAVAEEIVAHYSILFQHTLVTTNETILAFALSVAVGVPLGVSIAASKTVERIVYPLLVASQAIPKVAIAPLLTIWLGFGLEPKVLVGALVAVFPIVISTVVGLQSVTTEMTYLGRSMGLDPLRMFYKIGLPQALPSIMGGFKVAIALAVVGAIVGEFTGADRGLGYLLVRSVGLLDTRQMFAALVCLVTLGVVLFALVAWLETLLVRPRPSGASATIAGSA